MEIVAVTVCRNEEKLIRGCIESVMKQTLEAFYVVVDDCSTDRTREILDESGIRHIISLKEIESKIGGVHQAVGLVKGVKFAEKYVPNWKYLFNIDADTILPDNYFESMIQQMKMRPKVGIASGLPLVKIGVGYVPMQMDRRHASDSARVYRRSCWDDVGMLYPMRGYDTYPLLRARQLGWETTYFDIPYREERPWGKHTIKWWIGRGEARFVLGYPLRYHVLFSLSKVRQKPVFFGALATLMAYLLKHLTPWHRVFPEEYYRFVRDFTLRMAVEKIHVYLEKI